VVGIHKTCTLHGIISTWTYGLMYVHKTVPEILPWESHVAKNYDKMHRDHECFCNSFHNAWNKSTKRVRKSIRKHWTLSWFHGHTYHGSGGLQISPGGKNSKPQGRIIMYGKILLYIVHILWKQNKESIIKHCVYFLQCLSTMQ